MTTPLFDTTLLNTVAMKLVEKMYSLDGAAVDDETIQVLVDTYTVIIEQAIPLLKEHGLV